MAVWVKDKWATAWQNKLTFAPSKDSDQPGHPPSLIRVFAVRMKKHWVLSYPLSALWRLWSDWADAQADLSLCWAHRSFSWFCHEVAQMRKNKKKKQQHCILTSKGQLEASQICNLTSVQGSQVRVPAWPLIFRRDWSWKNFYGHSLLTADSSREVVKRMCN